MRHPFACRRRVKNNTLPNREDLGHFGFNFSRRGILSPNAL